MLGHPDLLTAAIVDYLIMPYSDYWAAPWVLDIARAIKPTRILDVGVGTGMYGASFRHALDIGEGRLTPAEWHCEIDGIELFAPYANPIWEYFYRNVNVGDAREILKNKEDDSYDLVFCGDMIEHLVRNDAIKLIEAMRRVGRHVIITTPRHFFAQGTHFGNEAETHLSHWTPADFETLGGKSFSIRSTFAAVFSRDSKSDFWDALDELPLLFDDRASTLGRCVKRWFPRMIKSRILGRRK
jgi:SAM-dependent methyltransferase